MSKKLFDICIGNPPYQGSNDQNRRQPPVYHEFMDAAYEVADCVELITPGRFLFNAGQTPKAWNEKMLSDPHFKVLHYESNSSKIFSNANIAGGVAITIHDTSKNYGAIEIFTEYKELNEILHKVIPFCNHSITNICIGAVPYHYTEILRQEHPEWVELAGGSFDLRTNTLDKLVGKIYFDEKPENQNCVQIFGLFNKKRTFMWVKKDYISGPVNFDKYKLFISKANGFGKFGATLPEMIVGSPYVGHTQSFISIGNFETIEEVKNLEKYIKTKFARALLSVLKVTQDINPGKWRYVPLQDFSKGSDIDWAKSIHEIDLQLYRKYNLDENEIAFIETNVKEMV